MAGVHPAIAPHASRDPSDTADEGDPQGKADAPSFRHLAFVSYARDSRTTAVSDMLKRELPAYRVPRPFRDRIRDLPREVFVDRASATAGENVREAFVTEVKSSRHLIVLCTEKSTTAPWVALEIAAFKAARGADLTRRILPVLVDGTPETSIPSSLEIAGDTRIDGPFWIDARAEDDRATVRRLREQKLRLLGPLLDLSIDELRQAQARRQLRNAIAIATAIGVLAAATVLGVSLVLEAQAAERTSRAEALTREAQLLGGTSGHGREAVSRALDVMVMTSSTAASGLFGRGVPEPRETFSALIAGVIDAERVRSVDVSGTITGAVDVGEHGVVLGTQEGEVVLVDADHRSVRRRAPVGKPVAALARAADGRVWAGTGTNEAVPLDVVTGALGTPVSFAKEGLLGVFMIAAHPSLDALAVIDPEGRVCTADEGRTIRCASVSRIDSSFPTSLAYDPIGAHVVAAAGGGAIEVRLAPWRSRAIAPCAQGGYIVSAAWHDGRLVVGQRDGAVCTEDAGGRMRSIRDAGGASLVALRAERTTMVVALADGRIEMSTDRSWTVLGILDHPEALAVAANGLRILVSSESGAVVAFATDGRRVFSTPGTGARVFQANLSARGDVATVVPSPGRAYTVGLDRGPITTALVSATGPITGVAWRGGRLMARGGDGELLSEGETIPLLFASNGWAPVVDDGGTRALRYEALEGFRIRTLGTRDERSVWPAPISAYPYALSASARWVAASASGSLEVRDVASGRTSLLDPRPAQRLYFVGDTQLVAAFGGLGDVCAWVLSSGEKWCAAAEPYLLEVSAAGARILLRSLMHVAVLRASNGELEPAVATWTKDAAIEAAALSPDGRSLAFAAFDSGGVEVRRFDAPDWKATLPTSAAPRSLAWVQGASLAVGLADGMVEIHAMSSTVAPIRVRAAAEPIRFLAFSPTGELLAAAGDAVRTFSSSRREWLRHACAVVEHEGCRARRTP